MKRKFYFYFEFFKYYILNILILIIKKKLNIHVNNYKKFQK